jgi:hypothetical protein
VTAADRPSAELLSRPELPGAPGGLGSGPAADRRLRAAGWLVLGGLLVATALGAATFDRASRPRELRGPLGEEATWSLQAASLAHDLDLVYGPADRDRFVAAWGMEPPDDIALRPADGGGGGRRVYDRPFLYALAAAPAAAVSPVRGPVFANAVWLALAAIAAARALGRRLGPVAPLLVAAVCFGSGAVGSVFVAQPDLFLRCITALGLSLAFGGTERVGRLEEVYRPAPRGARLTLRWLAAGALLAVPGVFRPLYLVLPLAALAAVPAERRRQGVAALAVGAVAVLALTAGVGAATGGGWLPWSDGVLAAFGEPHLDPSLLGWNALYLLAGRHLGLLPYFLPVLLAIGLAGGRSGGGRWALGLAVAVALVGFAIFSPFDLFGGPLAVGNRVFLPLYPALWFLAARAPARPGRAVAAALAVTAAAAPFLWPLWLAPRAAPLDPEGGYRYVGRLAERWLPYEATQEHLASGGELTDGGLWVRATCCGLAVDRPRHELVLAPGGEGEILVGSREPLTALALSFERRAPSAIEVEGAEPGETLLRGDGRVAFALTPDERAVHPIWWSGGDDVHLYLVRFRLPDAPPRPLRFYLTAGGW